jgi:MFS family permease
MLVGTVVFTLGYAVIAVTAKPPLVVVAAVFFLGNFVTGATALSYTLVKERHPDASGAATGALNSLGYFGAAIIPAAMGVTLDVYWTGETIRGSRIYSLAGYRLAFGVAALAGVVAVVCVAVVIHRSRR